MPDDLQIPPSAGGYGYRASYRAQSAGMDGMTRKLLIAAVGLGGVLLAGMGGWALLGGRSGPVPVIEADTRPLRVKPDNAGGMQVAGADEQVMGEQSRSAQAMAPRAEAPAPQALRAQQQLPPLPEVPTAPAPVASAPAPSPAAVPPGVSPLPDTPRPAARTAAPAARPAAPAAPASASPSATGATLVQLAAVDTEHGAQAEWQRLAKRMPDALGDRRLVLQRAERDGKAVVAGPHRRVLRRGRRDGVLLAAARQGRVVHHRRILTCRQGALVSLSLRERAGVRGSRLRSGARPMPLDQGRSRPKAALSRPLTPALSRGSGSSGGPPRMTGPAACARDGHASF